MIDVPQIFGSMVFNESTMEKELSAEVYNKMKKTIRNGEKLDLEISDAVAEAMKNWAIKKGATHYAHWFQPMVGVAAEKHDSFICKGGKGKVIMNFSGKELIRGEPDASSFSSGGLRSTFEARGYTEWDPTSYVFIKDQVLYIPAVFYSFNGEVLDNKSPLLKSMEFINNQSLRLLRLFGDNKTKRVIPTVGAEQEYFLIDKKLYEKRPDLLFCKRTLFGAIAPKTQEAEDHYFSSMSSRVIKFMQDLDIELWKIGILAKTKHNEMAPHQFELASIFTSANLAADNNQLVMERLKTVAMRHDFVCLLHEKPFEGINGSGKHNNWSLNKDDGTNLFDIGETENERALAMLFLCATIKAVEKYQDLLLASVASDGNDQRLGSFEAPPNIISIFLGKNVESSLISFASGKNLRKNKSDLEIGVEILPKIKKDSVDRNRTSPLAFTGNKFEFRMIGSSSNISWPNIVLNTIVAEEISFFADILEKSNDIKSALKKVVFDTLKNYKRIIYNGDNYSKKWRLEAQKRGLKCINSTEEALSKLLDSKNINLFVKNRIYNKSEIKSRYNALIENYRDKINVEVKVMLEMTKKEIIPVSIKYMRFLSDSIRSLESISDIYPVNAEKDMLEKITILVNETYSSMKNLSKVYDNTAYIDKNVNSCFYKDNVLPAMKKLRKNVDELEKNIGKSFWPYPTYGDLLFK